MTQLLAHLFGDYILQSDWMAQNKTKRSWPALVHALTYSLCFVPLCFGEAPNHSHMHHVVRLWGVRTVPLLFIVWTHFLIDRFRLARYVVWAKNWLGPKKFWYRGIAGGSIRWTDEVREVGPVKPDNYYIF
ncbi:MAG TPA: DUF3307 domain-containing protein [Candidatus Angelobacter sp.]|jgi:hypothetical protein|nr:DUF3307 domain-containing protein [Candidatus Angelobacter sp.]